MNLDQPSLHEIVIMPDPALTIRQFNDAFRKSFASGRVVMTAGIAALPEKTRTALLIGVQSFDRFDADNDPYGEHDFGAVEAGGIQAFWKIDPYDLALGAHSPDPTDPAVTTRLLTVMLAEEY